jgi:hypothetical protein
VPCNECDGRTTVPLVDEMRCDPELLKAYRDQQRAAADSRREQLAELRMGA